MALNDPLGDMIARIHNAQMRNKSKVSSPASRLRVSVLDVLKSEGYIRGYASVEHANGRNEIEIELKYFDGAPVIREISRVSKPGRRVYASVEPAARQQRPRRRDRLHAQGRDGRSRCARRQCRRRNPLYGVLDGKANGSTPCLVSEKDRFRSLRGSLPMSKARPSR